LLSLAGIAQEVAPKPASNVDFVAPVVRFELPSGSLTIHQAAQPRNPFSVVGETAAILGQQDGSFELWSFPVKMLAHFHIRTELADYPVPIDLNALAGTIDVSPDHTTITYTHAAFTVKQHMFVARGEDPNSPGPIVLFEIASNSAGSRANVLLGLERRSSCAVLRPCCRNPSSSLANRIQSFIVSSPATVLLQQKGWASLPAINSV